VRTVRWMIVAVVAVVVLGLLGCGGKDATTTSATLAETLVPTDYSQPAHWLAVPPSPDKKVDVLYVYPTVFSKAAPSDPDFSTVDDPKMMQGAQAAFQRQATAFAPSANLYAPYYRQVDAMYQLAPPAAQRIAQHFPQNSGS